MKKFAVINIENGEVLNIRTPYETPEGWVDGAVFDNRLLKELDLSVDGEEYLYRKVWRNDAWEDKGVKPSERHQWTADGWVEVINEEDEWSKIRGQRTYLLNLSDWTQVPDSPLTDAKKQEWGVYRQALRDVTTAQSSVERYEDIVWPTEPT